MIGKREGKPVLRRIHVVGERERDGFSLGNSVVAVLEREREIERGERGFKLRMKK